MTAALAYLGPPGTFSEQAAIEFDPAADRVPFPTITATCEAIFAADADRAILPLENSLAGSIGETHDLILQHHDLSLAGELILPIEHCLILPASAPSGEIDLIISHPQPLRQCHQYLQRRFPGVRTEATLSTAEAVAQAVQHGPGAAAIAPRRRRRAAWRPHRRNRHRGRQAQRHPLHRPRPRRRRADRPRQDHRHLLDRGPPGRALLRPPGLRREGHQPHPHRVAPRQGADRRLPLPGRLRRPPPR